jgi:hypothetical protein
MSLVDPFEALRAYANQGRSPLAGISTSTERYPIFDTETKEIGRVAHPTISPSIDEWDVGLRALAAGCINIDFLQKSSLSDSPPPSSDIGGRTTSNFIAGHRRDADCPGFATYRTNAGRPPLSNEQPHSHTREFHIRLAAMSLGRERPVRMPTDVDLGYIRFREELKQMLTDKGDECIWRGLEIQDEPRLGYEEKLTTWNASDLMDHAN